MRKEHPISTFFVDIDVVSIADMIITVRVSSTYPAVWDRK